MNENSATGDALSGLHVLEYPYRRSLGPVLSRFFTDLRDRKLTGIRDASGRVLVPPQEYDPETAETLHDFVSVGPGGEVVSYSWVAEPRSKQPFDHPFAYALIRLDGADTPMLHAVDAGEESRISGGSRVRPRWAAEPGGSILDLACFEVEEEG